MAINYRLSPKATWPDHIVDAKALVAWVKEHLPSTGVTLLFVAVSGKGRPAATVRAAGVEHRGPRVPAGLRIGRHAGSTPASPSMG